MGIKEAETDFDDSPEAGGKGRVTDPSVRLSIAMLLGAAFFYYMSYNTMTTNISRYADLFFGMGGGTFAVINIVTIVGALASYIPLANLSLKVGQAGGPGNRHPHGRVPGAHLGGDGLYVRVLPGVSCHVRGAGRG